MNISPTSTSAGPAQAAPADGPRRPRLAVMKFASCDGCQLQILSLEEELLTLADRVDIVHFLEATRTVEPGPYDVALIEGSVTTAHDAERIVQIRQQTELLVTIGACATAGGVQALRNAVDVDAWASLVYASPQWLDVLPTSTPIADHVKVDLALPGCPVNPAQLVEVVSALLAGRSPVLPRHAVCVDCKLAGHVCVTVADQVPCLGPVTSAGCGALCPSVGRGCYGCFGPAEAADAAALPEFTRAHLPLVPTGSWGARA